MPRTSDRLPVAAVLLAGLAGCQNQIGNEPIHDDRGAYNRWSVETVNDGAVRNAIIAQHTLYPYHFVEFSGELNDLGKRDVAVLASHFHRYPGQVNVRKGGEDGSLYQARMKAVADALVAGGVAPGAVKISDGLPGGDGMSANRVVVIMQADEDRVRNSGSQSGSVGGSAISGSSSGSTTGASSSPMPNHGN